MSLSNLLHENNYDLFCDDFTTNILTTTEINDQIEIPQRLMPSMAIYAPGNTGVTITLKYAINGPVNIFYDSATATLTTTNTSLLSFVLAGSDVLPIASLGIPEPKGSVGVQYRSPIIAIINDVNTLVNFIVEKVNSTSVKMYIKSIDGTNFPNSADNGVIAFSCAHYAIQD